MKGLSSQSGKNWRSAKIGRQGDPDAPVGSEGWAAYVANEIHSRVKDAESDARQAERWIEGFKSEDGHKALGFESWDEFCKSWIGYEAEQVETIISRRRKTQKKAQEYSGDELKAHGGDRSGGKGNAGDLDPNERGSDYLTARIARDHPEVHERMKDGEFSSVRQAAIEAGIIDDIRTKQIRETDDPEKMEAKIRHVYGDEVADRLFGGETEGHATEEEASGEKDAPSLEKVAVDSDPEDLFDISGLSRRQQNALLAGAISSSTPRTSGLALQVHYSHEELAECFGAALEQVNEWDAEDIARVACGQSDELTFSDWEGAEE